MSEDRNPVCGIVMPISAIDECTSDHWEDVRAILSEAAEAAGFDPILVSEAVDVGVIQKRIVQNLYTNEIVICDVSRKNPNVMFELGMRLAFDKPTIIVKDDKTNYSFDTAQIEHINYPHDLRYQTILNFKDDLSEKIKATFEASKKKDFTTFLRHFGDFKSVKISEDEVPVNQFILDELKNLREEIKVIHSSRAVSQTTRVRQNRRPPGVKSPFADLCIVDAMDKIEALGSALSMVDGVDSVIPYEFGGHKHLAILPKGIITGDLRANLTAAARKIGARRPISIR